jgi:hypothetical protein
MIFSLLFGAMSSTCAGYHGRKKNELSKLNPSEDKTDDYGASLFLEKLLIFSAFVGYVASGLTAYLIYVVSGFTACLIF